MTERTQLIIGFLIIFGGIFTAGLISNHRLSQAALRHDMILTCEQSYQVHDGELEEKCGDLIDRVGVDKVTNNHGRFSVKE